MFEIFGIIITELSNKVLLVIRMIESMYDKGGSTYLSKVYFMSILGCLDAALRQ